MLTSHRTIAVAILSVFAFVYSRWSGSWTPNTDISTQHVSYQELVTSPGRLVATEHHRIDETALVVVDLDTHIFGTIEGQILVVRDVLSGSESQFVLFDYMGPKEVPAHQQSIIPLSELGAAREAISYLCAHEEDIANHSEHRTDFSYYATSGFGFGMKAPARGKPGSLLVALDSMHDLERARKSGQPLPISDTTERFVVVGGRSIDNPGLKSLSNLLDRIAESAQALPK